MIRKFIAGLALASACLTSQAAVAQDPFAFQFGYSLGFAQRYRTNVPTPPYFALHPPVYYGQRYYRPYGASPFASWPMLQPNPSYAPVSEEMERARQGYSVPQPAPIIQTSVMQPELVMIQNPYAKANRLASAD